MSQSMSDCGKGLARLVIEPALDVALSKLPPASDACGVPQLTPSTARLSHTSSDNRLHLEKGVLGDPARLLEKGVFGDPTRLEGEDQHGSLDSEDPKPPLVARERGNGVNTPR